jgi:hypothetical protein
VSLFGLSFCAILASNGPQSFIGNDALQQEPSKQGNENTIFGQLSQVSYDEDGKSLLSDDERELMGLIDIQVVSDSALNHIILGLGSNDVNSLAHVIVDYYGNDGTVVENCKVESRIMTYEDDINNGNPTTTTASTTTTTTASTSTSTGTSTGYSSTGSVSTASTVTKASSSSTTSTATPRRRTYNTNYGHTIMELKGISNNLRFGNNYDIASYSFKLRVYYGGYYYWYWYSWTPWWRCNYWYNNWYSWFCPCSCWRPIWYIWNNQWWFWYDGWYFPYWYRCWYWGWYPNYCYWYPRCWSWWWWW